jgi:hypothetical protein
MSLCSWPITHQLQTTALIAPASSGLHALAGGRVSKITNETSHRASVTTTPLTLDFGSESPPRSCGSTNCPAYHPGDVFALESGLRSSLGEGLFPVGDRRTGCGLLPFSATNSFHASGTSSSWTIASTGHSALQASQSMHSSGSMNSICSPSRKQSQGQTTTQSVYLHPKHGSVTT